MEDDHLPRPDRATLLVTWSEMAPSMSDDAFKKTLCLLAD